MNTTKLILASGSPRRRELLTLAGYDFEVIVSDADEHVGATDPARFVELASLKKAEAVFASHADRTVIGSDTVVAIDGRIIGKPRDEADAYDTLFTLSGRTHIVYTGVTVLAPGRFVTFHDATSVTFAKLSEAEIRRYIATGEPLDKAGAYGIQGPASVFVDHIEGCYFTIIGMPLPKLYRTLKEFGIYPQGFMPRA